MFNFSRRGKLLPKVENNRITAALETKLKDMPMANNFHRKYEETTVVKSRWLNRAEHVVRVPYEWTVVKALNRRASAVCLSSSLLICPSVLLKVRKIFNYYFLQTEEIFPPNRNCLSTLPWVTICTNELAIWSHKGKTFPAAKTLL